MQSKQYSSRQDNDGNYRSPYFVERLACDQTWDGFYQRLVCCKKLAWADIADALQIAASKGSIVQRDGARIGIGIAGDLASDPIAAACVGHEKRRTKFISTQ